MVSLCTYLKNVLTITKRIRSESFQQNALRRLDNVFVDVIDRTQNSTSVKRVDIIIKVKGKG